MRRAWTWLIIAGSSCLLLLLFSHFLGSCGKTTTPTKAETQADSLHSTRPDFDQRQRRADSLLTEATRRADSLTIAARVERVAAGIQRRRADSLAALQDWHAAYLERSAEADQLRASIAKDSAAHVADSLGQAAILSARAELQKRLDVAELQTIPEFRRELEAERRRSARQRWAGRIEGFTTGAVLGAATGAIVARAVLPR